MSIQEETTMQIVLHEGNQGRTLEASDRYAALSALLDNGYAVSCTNQSNPPPQSDAHPLLVLGRFEGEPPSWDSGDSPSSTVQFQDIEGLQPDQITETVEKHRADFGAARHGDWKPWFPVIDYDRCTNCMQCLSFCLFGVYGVDDHQQIQVQNNDQCKTNCPACSRVCPEAAIMFPKYRSGPINGAPVSDQDMQREKMKVDISSLLGGDIYQMLRDRSAKAKSRFAKERDSDKALSERQKCLTKLQQAGDIPPEVLSSLPSPDEIQRRAQEAGAKAEAARQQQQQRQQQP